MRKVSHSITHRPLLSSLFNCLIHSPSQPHISTSVFKSRTLIKYFYTTNVSSTARRHHEWERKEESPRCMVRMRNERCQLLCISKDIYIKNSPVLTPSSIHLQILSPSRVLQGKLLNFLSLSHQKLLRI